MCVWVWGVLVVPTYLVDPVQDEGHAGHEGGLEHAGVPLPPLLDHAGLVREGVGSAVAYIYIYIARQKLSLLFRQKYFLVHTVDPS